MRAKRPKIHKPTYELKYIAEIIWIVESARQKVYGSYPADMRQSGNHAFRSAAERLLEVLGRELRNLKDAEKVLQDRWAEYSRQSRSKSQPKAESDEDLFS